MTAAAVRKSAYPVAVEDLIPQARRLATQLGAVPSRNRLMAEYRIGASKARTILAALAAETATVPGDTGAEEASPAAHDAPSVSADGGGGPRLRAVPDAAPEPAAVPGTGPAEQPATTADTAPGAPVSPVQVGTGVDLGAPGARWRVSRWPLLLLAAPAFVAVWSGWVGLGSLAGFGMVHPLPGIADQFSINSAITLPVGVETYAAYALRAWLSGPAQARRFAKWSAIGSLVLGAAGQIAYHLLSASGVRTAPWPITTVVACLPVAVLGMGAALAHLLHTDTDTEPVQTEQPTRPAADGGGV